MTHRQTGGGAGSARAAIDARQSPATGPARGRAGRPRWAAREHTAHPTSARHAVEPRAPVRASGEPYPIFVAKASQLLRLGAMS